MVEPLTLIAGPCVIENESTVNDTCAHLKEITDNLNINLIFKASFDKANRSSINSFRGPGINKGLSILEKIKNKFKVKILTDIHESYQADLTAEVVDVIQIPAFLSRQTDLLVSATKAVIKKNKIINIKKGQFLAPWDMEQVLNKINESGLPVNSKKIWLTERGNSFGYNTLVVDFRSLVELKKFNCPVIFDATHSVQQPGGKGTCSGGQREFVAPLGRAAIAVGVDGIFMEVHPDPENAKSDGPNMVPLDRVEKILNDFMLIRNSLGHSLAVSTL
ncbi:3-deoxy-8-phosphooctulonate synthase [Prochlorococcus sp. AH-736-E15]|nr:3-deoxy-8-phosphooctulonate synthase [Prochlorococcus sp. AH-736-E15]